VAAAVPVGEAFAYRNHAQLHISPEGPGYIRADQKGVLPIRGCPLMANRLARMFTELSFPGGGIRRIFLRAGLRSGEEMVVLELADGTLSNITGCGCFHEEVLGMRYRISASSFFQVNTMGAGALVTTVLDLIEPDGADSILDLYSGVGLFSLPLAQRVRSVKAVESHPQAVSDALCNLKAAGLENCQLIEGPVHDVLEELKADFTAVIVDPPRRGCGEQVMNQLAALHPARIVYVSCDPATLARDARYLADRGYCLTHVQPLDLFPQTFHIECVALFIAE
jgi:23S rRNA (uracil1939-C5)-methyltransferase